MTVARKIAGVAGTAAVIYAAWVRPRLMRWGATDEEVAGPYPGADLVPDGERGATMAVTIDAPPDQVWSWLVWRGDRGDGTPGTAWITPVAQVPEKSARVARPRRRRLREVLDPPPRPCGRLGGCSARTEPILRTAWIDRSATPQPRSKAAPAIGLH